MSNIPIDPNVIPLLQGLKPYLGGSGQVLTDGVLSMIQLLSSHSGQNAVHTMSQLFNGTPGQGSRVVTVNTALGPVTFSLGIAFGLFLILILLILSGSLLAMNPGITSEGIKKIEPPVSDGVSIV